MDALRGNRKNLGGFLYAQTAEETKLDDASFAFIEPGKRIERVVQANQLLIALDDRDIVSERDPAVLSGALFGSPGSRCIHEDPAHDLGGDREEVRAILPANTLRFNEAQEGLIDERGGLKCVMAALAHEIVLCAPVQLGVDQGNQTVERRSIAPPPGSEERRHRRAVRNCRIHEKSLC